MWKTINNEYFSWLCDLVDDDRYSEDFSYRKLLMHLHSKEFIFTIPRDANRANDGFHLRHKFACDCVISNAEEYLDEPCSVLEMMVALAIRCENNIMDDPSVGDRTAQWFWNMIVNLGLGSMSDGRYNKQIVDDIIEKFLNREYEPDGKGGLFTIRNCDRDLRTVEIWCQLCWYLDTI